MEDYLKDYNAFSLPQLAWYMHREYYYPLLLLCHHALAPGNLRSTEDSVTEHHSLFFQSANKWVAHTTDFLIHRRDVVMPYVRELSGKETAGHNCEKCSGKCDMQHTGKIIEFTSSLQHIQEKNQHFGEVIEKSLNSRANTEKSGFEKMLLFLYDRINDLCKIESGCLIPGIRAAQKNIHAN